MKKTFFARYSFLILLAVCFCTPLIMRGAREALRNTKNDVKNWLPSRFQETGDIEWFWRHFAGERFIIVTWPGCTGEPNDEAFQLFKKKLAPSIPPTKQGQPVPQPPAKDVGSTWLQRPTENFIGDKLGLYAITNEYYNWGGLKEKWLKGEGGKWYYVLPNGDLFAFEGGDGPLPAACRALWHGLGWYKLSGKHLASFHKDDGPWYYQHPTRLSAQFFRSVVTGPDVFNELTKQNEDGVSMMSEREAMSKLKGVLFGPDERQTALVITVTDAGRKDFHTLLSRGLLGKERGLLYKIAEECGIRAEDLKLGGPPVDNVAIDEEGTTTLVRLVSLCVALGLTLSYLSFRSLLATITLFFTGGISAVLGLAFVGWSGAPADAVMMSMPALVYVLGISGAVHFINYYREEVEERGLEGAPERALAHAWKPAILCNMTTSFGLLSLYSAEVVPIRYFGIFGALGVMGTTILLFTFVPAMLQMWPPKLAQKQKRLDGAENWLDAYLANYWERFGSWIIRHYISVGTACVLVIATVGWGAWSINTSVNLLELFDGDAKILKDYAWIEHHLGKLIPMEVVVKFSPDSLRKLDAEQAEGQQPVSDDRAKLSTIDRVEAVARVQTYIARYLGEGRGGAGVVGQSMSAVSFISKLPNNYAGRLAADQRLVQEREELLKSDFFKIDHDDNSELWRISLRVAAFMGVDYGDFVKDVRSVVEPVLAAYNVRYQIIQSAADRQAKRPESEQNSKLIRVALVMPDELRKSAFPPAPKKKRASEKAKEKEAAEAEAAADGQEPETPTDQLYTGVAIDQHLVFTQTLYDVLKLVGAVRVELIPESTFKKEQLPGLDTVVLLGNLQPATIELIKAESLETIDAKAVLAESLPKPGETVASRTTLRTTSAIYTGVVPIVYKAQRTLLTSLIQSTIWSFATITPLMILVSRSISAGLVAMLPNALPVLVIFGAMGWMRIKVDIGSMMTASIALGVAVDDTIHYLTWFREELQRLGDRNQAIIGAYRRCATPTFQAAMISGLGLSIFAFSTFTPTQRFGYLMLAILIAGVVAELIFFPALLASPLGWVFKVPRKPQEVPAEVSGDGVPLESESDTDAPATVRIDKARDASKRIA